MFLAVPPLVLPAVALMLPRLHGLGAAPGAGQVRRRTLPALAVAAGVGVLQYAGQRLNPVSLALRRSASASWSCGLSRLLPNGILRAGRGLPTAVLMRGILAGAFFGAETFVPLMLVNERGLATALAGVTLTAAARALVAGLLVPGPAGPDDPAARPGPARHGAGRRGVAGVVAGAVAGAAAGGGRGRLGHRRARHGAGDDQRERADARAVPAGGAGARTRRRCSSPTCSAVILIVGLGGAIFAGCTPTAAATRRFPRDLPGHGGGGAVGSALAGRVAAAGPGRGRHALARAGGFPRTWRARHVGPRSAVPSSDR